MNFPFHPEECYRKPTWTVIGHFKKRAIDDGAERNAPTGQTGPTHDTEPQQFTPCALFCSACWLEKWL
jgi:hypothetical protein